MNALVIIILIGILVFAILGIALLLMMINVSMALAEIIKSINLDKDGITSKTKPFDQVKFIGPGSGEQRIGGKRNKGDKFNRYMSKKPGSNKENYKGVH